MPRKPRSVSPVSLTIRLFVSAAERATCKGRFLNLIDDMPHAAEVDSKETDTGITFRLRYGTGPEGRLSKAAIVKSLRKWKDKGRIQSAIISTNEVSV